MCDKIASVEDCLKKVWEVYSTIGAGSNRPLFFRGHADHKWSLLPRVMRESKCRERELILDFKQVFAVEADYLHNMERMLTTMQHHGVPTRMLDWSISPLTALWFACSDKDKMDSDGEIFALNPWSAYRKAFICNCKPTYYFELMKQVRFCLALGWSYKEISNYIQRKWNYFILSEELTEPLPIVGRYMDERVSHQQGMFLLWGHNMRSLEFQPSYRECFKSFPIDKKSKLHILSQLAQLGYTNFTIFRDIEGFQKATVETGSIFRIK